MILFSAAFFCTGCKGGAEKNAQSERQTASLQKPSEPAKEPPRVIEGKDGAQMVYVPEGVFFMGDNEGEPAERPRMQVFLEAFYIDRFEISNEQFEKFIKNAGYKAEGGFKFQPGREQYPAQWLTWKDADAYCKWIGERLPTEYEWEKAARGTDGRSWPWGSEEKKPQKLNDTDISKMIHEFDDSAGQSPFGCLHMADNVWEWVDDWFSGYVLNPIPDSRYGEKYKVLRGGLEVDGKKIRYSRATKRLYSAPGSATAFTGGRCARDP